MTACRDIRYTRDFTIEKATFHQFIISILRHYKKISMGLLQSYLKHRWGLPKSDDYATAMGHPDMRLWQYLQKQAWLTCEKTGGEPSISLVRKRKISFAEKIRFSKV
jgi:hypothetical protein